MSDAEPEKYRFQPEKRGNALKSIPERNVHEPFKISVGIPANALDGIEDFVMG